MKRRRWATRSLMNQHRQTTPTNTSTTGTSPVASSSAATPPASNAGGVPAVESSTPLKTGGVRPHERHDCGTFAASDEQSRLPCGCAPGHNGPPAAEQRVVLDRYEVNKHGVVLDPESVELLSRKKDKVALTVKYAETKDGRIATSFSFGKGYGDYSGSSGPVTDSSGGAVADVNAAKVNAIECALRILKGDDTIAPGAHAKHAPKAIAKLEAMLAALRAPPGAVAEVGASTPPPAAVAAVDAYDNLSRGQLRELAGKGKLKQHGVNGRSSSDKIRAALRAPPVAVAEVETTTPPPAAVVAVDGYDNLSRGQLRELAGKGKLKQHGVNGNSSSDKIRAALRAPPVAVAEVETTTPPAAAVAAVDAYDDLSRGQLRKLAGKGKLKQHGVNGNSSSKAILAALRASGGAVAEVGVSTPPPPAVVAVDAYDDLSRGQLRELAGKGCFIKGTTWCYCY